MKKLFLSGTLHPERAMLSVSNLEHEFTAPDGKKQGRIKFNVYSNQVTAFVEWENASEDIYTIRNITRTSVELITNVVGFLKGYAYDVEITKIFDGELDLSFVFGIQIPALEERNKSRDSSGVNHIYPLCFGTEGVYLRRCLSDLSMAIKHADDTPFYCFRALESLKQYFGFVNELAADREQWEAMASVVGGKPEDIEPIRALAFPARHGVPDPITDQKRRDVFFLTWDIVDRFIDFKLKQSGSNYRLQPTSAVNGASGD
jgi:hypothetical protein